MEKIKINKEFSPSANLRILFIIYGISIFAMLALFCLMPIIISSPVWISIISVLSFSVAAIFVFCWIPKYCGTMKYMLTRHEITWRRGVWFHDTGIVPYNRITNIDISQGPLSRKLGIAVLKIQTAGYSGQNASSEIKIEGVENSEEMRDLIMNYVRGNMPVSTESHYEDSGNGKVLGELVKIRKLLEKKG